jgi:hypothetical protein
MTGLRRRFGVAKLVSVRSGHYKRDYANGATARRFPHGVEGKPLTPTFRGT